jgi:hypothetical protein
MSKDYSEMLFQALKPRDPAEQVENLRKLAEQAERETRAGDEKDRLDASMVRLELDQCNHNLMAEIEAHRAGGSE